MNTVFDPDKWKNKNSKSETWYTVLFMEKNRTDQFCIPKYKEGENDTKAQCKNDRNTKYVTSSISIPCSFFLSSDLRKCDLKSLKTDSKPKKINRKDQLINSNLMCTDHSCKKYCIIEADES